MEVFSVGDVIQVKDKEYLERHRRESVSINEIMMRAADSIGVVSKVLRKDRSCWKEVHTSPAGLGIQPGSSTIIRKRIFLTLRLTLCSMTGGDCLCLKSVNRSLSPTQSI